eukprot:COSAG01_NODE_144_length_24108_cov_11.490441_29_plen_81_part_00
MKAARKATVATANAALAASPPHDIVSATTTLRSPQAVTASAEGVGSSKAAHGLTMTREGGAELDVTGARATTQSNCTPLN